VKFTVAPGAVQQPSVFIETTALSEVTEHEPLATTTEYVAPAVKAAVV
jgi:hypothetical protein